MKCFARMVLATVSLLIITAIPRSVCAGNEQASVVLIDPGSKAARELEQFHAFIDILPHSARLDVAVLPLDNDGALQLMSLDRDARAGLHVKLQNQAMPVVVTERMLIASFQQAVDTLARAPGERLLILASDNVSNSEGWNAAIADAVASRVRVVLLTGDVHDSDFQHPLVRQTMGRQIGVTGTLLSGVVQATGLLAVDLRTLSEQGAREAIFTLDANVALFTVFLGQSTDGMPIEVVTPAGQAVHLDATAPGSIYAGADYTCWHLAKEDAIGYGWDGTWSIKTGVPGQLAVWLLDSIELKAEAALVDGKRLLTTSVWRSGSRLSASELSGERFQLISLNGEPLLLLNDIGIGGDLVPGDGVFSVVLPDYLLPTAGSAVVRVDGRIQRSSSVRIVPLPSSPPATAYEARVIAGGLLALVGLTGAVLCVRKRPADQVLRHTSAAGYHRVVPLVLQPVTAGTNHRCHLRMGVSSAPMQLRFRPNRKGVILDVLAVEPETYINGERVYLSRALRHGDEITVCDDRFVFQDRRQLRIGRRVAGSRQEMGS